MDVVAPALAHDSAVTVFGINKWPVNLKTVQDHFEKSKKIVFFEEHQLQGGLSQKIAALLDGPRKNIHIQAVSNSKANGSRNYLLESQGFGSQNISKIIFSIKD